MRRITVGVSILLGLSLCVASAKEQTYTQHQIYKTDTPRAIVAVGKVLHDLGLGTLGIDEARGLLVSGASDVEAKNVKDIYKFSKDARIFYFLVVLIAPREPGQVQVQVLTVLRYGTVQKPPAGVGTLTTGNSLSERVYSALEGELGQGLLGPWKD